MMSRKYEMYYGSILSIMSLMKTYNEEFLRDEAVSKSLLQF